MFALRTLLILFLGILPLIIYPREAAFAAPSFKCSGQNSKVEKLICNDEELSELDRRLSAGMKELKRITAGYMIDGLIEANKAAIKARNKCDNRNCVRMAYEAWLRRVEREVDIPGASLHAHVPSIGDTCRVVPVPGKSIAAYSEPHGATVGRIDANVSLELKFILDDNQHISWGSTDSGWVNLDYLDCNTPDAGSPVMEEAVKALRELASCATKITNEANYRQVSFGQYIGNNKTFSVRQLFRSYDENIYKYCPIIGYTVESFDIDDISDVKTSFDSIIPTMGRVDILCKSGSECVTCNHISPDMPRDEKPSKTKQGSFSFCDMETAQSVANVLKLMIVNK